MTNKNRTAPARYTINRDGTLEKWYLEHDDGTGTIYLRKTPQPKWNCCMKEFPADQVYNDRRAAIAALKARSNPKNDGRLQKSML